MSAVSFKCGHAISFANKIWIGVNPFLPFLPDCILLSACYLTDAPCMDAAPGLLILI